MEIRMIKLLIKDHVKTKHSGPRLFARRQIVDDMLQRQRQQLAQATKQMQARQKYRPEVCASLCLSFKEFGEFQQCVFVSCF